MLATMESLSTIRTILDLWNDMTRFTAVPRRWKDETPNQDSKERLYYWPQSVIELAGMKHV